MTLVEICVATGLISVVVLAMAEMTYFSARATRASDAMGDLNNAVAAVVTAINTVQPYQGDYTTAAYSQSGGCNQIFYGMPASVAGVGPSPSPSPFAAISLNYNSTIASPPPATPAPLLIQTTTPALAAISYHYMQITSITMNQVDGPLGSRYDPQSGNTAHSYLYSILIQAQKNSDQLGLPQVGGNTVYSKTIMVQLWVMNNSLGVPTFMGCS